jgi:hypothetical protein
MASAVRFSSFSLQGDEVKALRLLRSCSCPQSGHNGKFWIFLFTNKIYFPNSELYINKLFI